MILGRDAMSSRRILHHPHARSGPPVRRVLAALIVAGALGGTSGALASNDRESEYRLGSGDKLRVITFGEESLTGEFSVSGGGKVSLPLVGEVQAAGLTVPEFQRGVENALKKGYMNQPRVSVEVINYRPFYILGEVTRPGEYPYTSGLTVLDAVATANGFTYRANTKKVWIRHRNSETEGWRRLTGSTQVEPGDTIKIGERFF
jgi:polysaccharide export outer membrane protein